MSMIPVRGGAEATPPMGRLERFLLAWKAKILLLFGLKAAARDVFEDILRRSQQ